MMCFCLWFKPTKWVCISPVTITRYVDREAKQEAFRLATLKAWEAFWYTGLQIVIVLAVWHQKEAGF